MRASLIFSSTSHSINVQKVILPSTTFKPLLNSFKTTRSSKSSFPKRSTLNAPSPRLKTLANLYSYINRWPDKWSRFSRRNSTIMRVGSSREQKHENEQRPSERTTTTNPPPVCLSNSTFFTWCIRLCSAVLVEQTAFTFFFLEGLSSAAIKSYQFSGERSFFFPFLVAGL